MDIPGSVRHRLHICKVSLPLEQKAVIEKAYANEILEKYHIYMADTSRISIAGLNDGNLDYFAAALDQAVRLIK